MSAGGPAPKRPAVGGETHDVPQRGARRAGRRVLGDEWSDWQPADDDAATRTIAGPGLFLLPQALGAVAAVTAWWALVWLIQPRLVSLGLAGDGFVALRWAGTAFLAMPLGLVAWTALGGPLAPWSARWGASWIVSSWGPSLWIGRRLGIGRDQLGHAFVLLANRLALAGRLVARGEGVMVLAPRCLHPEAMGGLRAAAQQHHAGFVVATGGEEARAAIQQHDPAAVLAVACERDLVAGLRDVLPRRMVLSLPNSRPEGPCRNSWIDLETAIRYLDCLERVVREVREAPSGQ